MSFNYFFNSNELKGSFFPNINRTENCKISESKRLNYAVSNQISKKAINFSEVLQYAENIKSRKKLHSLDSKHTNDFQTNESSIKNIIQRFKKDIMEKSSPK
jgi:hypothetical protein